MATRKCVTVSISPELHAVGQRLLTSGRYGNFSEVIRASLRLLDEQERRFSQHCASADLAEQA